MTAKRIRYETSAENFPKIPGCPIAYKATPEIISIYEKAVVLDKACSPRQGLASADTDRFLKLWYEVSSEKSLYNANNSTEAKLSNKSGSLLTKAEHIENGMATTNM